jgi:hypothetical protein
MSVPRHAIFISYRRVDSVYAVDQLDERLKQAFGVDAVFRDTSSVALGGPFPDRIRRALEEARVVILRLLGLFDWPRFHSDQPVWSLAA